MTTPTPTEADKFTQGIKREFGTFSANMIYRGEEAICVVYGIPQNTTVEEMRDDKRLSETFKGGMDMAARIVSALNQQDEQREALRLAKEAGYDAVARLNELTRVYEKQYGTSGTIDFYEAIEKLKSALAAIEKVEG